MNFIFDSNTGSLVPVQLPMQLPMQLPNNFSGNIAIKPQQMHVHIHLKNGYQTSLSGLPGFPNLSTRPTRPTLPSSSPSLSPPKTIVHESFQPTCDGRVIKTTIYSDCSRKTEVGIFNAT